MACNRFFDFCCGEAEEEVKYGALIPRDDDLGWNTDATTSSNNKNNNLDNSSNHSLGMDDGKERIRRIEEKVTLINRHRSKEQQRPGIRGTITCKPIDMTEYCQNHQPPSFPKSNQEIAFLSQVLKESLMIVLDLEDSEIQLLCMAMQKETVAPGTTIIRKGDIGDYFYIIDQGEVLFVDPDKEESNLGRVGRGNAFGELALL
jgi:hypothetical protein